MQLVTEETRSTLQQHHPEALQELDHLAASLDASSIDPELMELCRAFFASSLRGDAFSPNRELSELETDCLAMCEQFMVSVSTMSEEQVAALARHLGADDLYVLMYAVYLLEMSERLNLMLKGMMQ